MIKLTTEDKIELKAFQKYIEHHPVSIGTFKTLSGKEGFVYCAGLGCERCVIEDECNDEDILTMNLYAYIKEKYPEYFI